MSFQIDKNQNKKVQEELELESQHQDLDMAQIILNQTIKKQLVMQVRLKIIVHIIQDKIQPFNHMQILNKIHLKSAMSFNKMIH